MLKDALTKWQPALELGWVLSPVVWFVNRYLFNDWEFFITLCVVVLVDTLLGVWCAWRASEVSSRGFGRIIQKLGFYFLFLVATHALAQHRVQGEVNSLLTWVDSWCYAILLVREFLSILEKSAKLGLFHPPAWLLKRLAVFHASEVVSEPEDKPYADD